MPTEEIKPPIHRLGNSHSTSTPVALFLAYFWPKTPLESTDLVVLIGRFLISVPHPSSNRAWPRTVVLQAHLSCLGCFALFSFMAVRCSSRGLSPVGVSFAFPFNSKPPRLLAERSADGRSAEGACGASLSCCERGCEAQLRELGHSRPQ